MHRPFVTTVKFENEDGDIVRGEYAVAAVDTSAAKIELERRFLDLLFGGFDCFCFGRSHSIPGQTLEPPAVTPNWPLGGFPDSAQNSHVSLI